MNNFRLRAYNFQRRCISDKDVLKSLKNVKTTTITINRNSKYDSNIGNVIKLLEKKKYEEVRKFVNDKKIDIDSHTMLENTPLTDAAYRGDTETIRFLIDEFGANIHASCDCPYHKTALHYASEQGHYLAVKMLLDKGAQPNALDSRKFTALNVAANDNIKKLLIASGGVDGKDVPKDFQQKLNLPKANCQLRLKK